MASRFSAKSSKQSRGFSLQSEGGESDTHKERSALQIIEGDALRHKKLLSAIVIVLFSALIFFYYRDVKNLIVIVAFIALGSLSRVGRGLFRFQ